MQSNVHLSTTLHYPKLKDVLKWEKPRNGKVKRGDATIEGVKGKFAGEWQSNPDHQNELEPGTRIHADLSSSSSGRCIHRD